MKDQDVTWEMSFSLIVAAAMKMAIVLWDSKEVQSMTKEGRAELMASVTKSYADTMIAEAKRHFGDTSSS